MLRYHRHNGLGELARVWETYQGYTVRPVPSTVGFYRLAAHWNLSAPSRVLVYGGTPEIRDAVALEEVEVVIVDRDPDMVAALGTLTCSGKPVATHEQFVQGDWRKLPLADRSVDFAFGDDAINMVPWQDFETFLAETHRVLRPGGLFFCHLLVKPSDELIGEPVTESFRAYLSGMISHYELASRVNFSCFEQETFQMGWRQSERHLRRLLNQGIIASDHGLIDRFELCNSSFCCPPVALWEKLVGEYFEIADVFTPTEYEYCEFEPLYTLRRK